MPSDLRTFIATLEHTHQLTRISATTDPLLEIAAITCRICQQQDGGPALLFESPRGSRFPVATNLLGSHQRVALASGTGDLNKLTIKIRELLRQLPNLQFETLDQQLSQSPVFSSFARTPATPAWDQTQPVSDLSLFPFLQNWPGDGSANGFPRYITLGQCHTTAPDGSTPNCGVYRAQICGKQQLAIRWNATSGAARHLKQYRRNNLPMPVALALGGDPGLLLAAMMPLPGNLDEVTFAGFLQGAPQQFSPCATIPLSVPASAELVIEGFVSPNQFFQEGPYGNHTGSYSPAGKAALMQITRISHRPDAIIPATVVGPPPMEDCWMTGAWERVLLAFLSTMIPAIVDIHIPLAWSFHQSAIISLETPSSGMVRDISAQLWKLSWFSASRILVFVAADETPLAKTDISWRCINLVDATDDMIFDATHTKIALDATGRGRTTPRLIHDTATEAAVSGRWEEFSLA